MIETFNKSEFKKTPWKNGGGLTTEIFRQLHIRISCAEVGADGPFSAFPNIDRILLLIDGSGFDLKSTEREFRMNKKLDPLHFQGEEIFACSLIDGPCTDFNVMTDRSLAKSVISVIHPEENQTIPMKAECDLKLIYDIAAERLYKLDAGDSYNLEVKKDSSYIVIETTLI